MTPQPTAGDVSPQQSIVFPTNLPDTDGEPLKSAWHRNAINLLLDVICYWFRDRHDFYAGGNMFLYYSTEQVKNRDYRGPDFFFVWGVERDRMRRYWAVWEENGKYPAVIIELMSPTTAREDRTTKKKLYERTFSTREYFLYDPETQQLEGWRLHGTNGYEPIKRESNGHLWSKELELYLGFWKGSYLGEPEAMFPRFFDVRGNLVLMAREDEKQRADTEKQRADTEKQRADTAEAELVRLREQLLKLQAQQPQPPAG